MTGIHFPGFFLFLNGLDLPGPYTSEANVLGLL